MKRKCCQRSHDVSLVEPLNNGHIGDRFIVLCKEVVLFGSWYRLNERTHSQTTSCLASRIPRLPIVGTGCAHSHNIACSPDHDHIPRYWPSSHIARVAPRSAGMGNSTPMTIMRIVERVIVGLSVLGGYFI